MLAIDDQLDGGGNGGTLNSSFNGAPPPPVVDIAVNRYGKVNARTGIATISGNYTCTNAGFIEVFGDARQNAGRFTILGSFYFFDTSTCDGAQHSWTAQVYPQSGKFAGGKAMMEDA